MKRILFFLIPLISSCGFYNTMSYSYDYHQIVTVKTTDMETPDDGIFRYVENGVIISYNFWSENGDPGFVITNTNNYDIFFDFSKSFYIKEGVALNLHPQQGQYPVERIPAGLSKVYNEYSILEHSYRYCKFARNPQDADEEIAIKDFTPENTPVNFGHRLVFSDGRNEFTVNTNFYISRLYNVYEHLAIRTKTEEWCGEQEQNRVYIYKSPDRFFVKYQYDGGITDRYE